MRVVGVPDDEEGIDDHFQLTALVHQAEEGIGGEQDGSVVGSDRSVSIPRIRIIGFPVNRGKPAAPIPAMHVDEIFRNGPVREIRPCTQGMTTATAWGFQALVEIGIIPQQPPAGAPDDRSFLAGMGAGVNDYPGISVCGVRV